jgi:hypothetical protein
MQSPIPSQSPEEATIQLQEWMDRVVATHGGPAKAIKPGNRTKFHWPPHAVSYSFHVSSSDWSDHASFEAHGEIYEVAVAQTKHGVFGRVAALWLEARGEDREEMLVNLREAAEPLFQRQLTIARSLEKPGRFVGAVRDVDPVGLIKLLFSEDRDVAFEAKTVIETKASRYHYMPLLLFVLRDRSHPYRRSAQWCVLDLFEDLPSFCQSHADEIAAVAAMKDLIWDAEDDYARTIYKAGVVLGGHLPYDFGGPVLLECLHAPSKIGRRSAIHGLFHVVEWIPDMYDRVVAALEEQATDDPDPLLRAFAREMALDVAAGNLEHVIEPVFPDEE